MYRFLKFAHPRILIASFKLLTVVNLNPLNDFRLDEYGAIILI